MIELLGQRAGQVGLNIVRHVMDPTDLSFGDDRSDAVASLNGVSTLPNADVALAEMTRVTRPGSQVLVIAFGAWEKADWLGLIRGVVGGCDGFTRSDGPPLPLQFSDMGVFRRHLEEVGLAEIRVVAHQEEIPMATGRALWDLYVSSDPVGTQMTASLSDSQKSSVIDALDDQLAHKGGQLRTELNIGVGVWGRTTRSDRPTLEPERWRSCPRPRCMSSPIFSRNTRQEHEHE
ncbi:MAG TPA: methyltransferase domain-containing protein [Acidimicrobiia bacterium]|nr:methyltransferase domain-containing protein [Acidimicrobiia bacterium]